MEENYDKAYWGSKKCPPVDCKKDACKCGLKKVFLPASLGDDSPNSPIAPKNGAYCNAIVVYEANDHVYIYSTEGVPTLINVEGGDAEEIIEELEKKLDKEILDRGAADDVLQQEIDDLKNSPDVVDIVATYAALQAYDTSKLGDNDIIRVLTDENHDGASTYYRWDKPNNTFVYIGEVGDYYTKGQVDTLLGDKQDKLTAGSNINISAQNVISATDTTYSDFVGATIQQAGVAGLVPAPTTSDPDKYLKGDGSWSTPTDTTYTAGTNVQISSGNVISATDTTYSNFVGTDGQTAGTAGLVPAPATTDADKFLKSDGTWDTAGGGGPTVVQTMGTSITDVMSQNATTSMIYSDPSTQKKIKIGYNAYSSPGDESVEIGKEAKASNTRGIAIGGEAKTEASYSVAIGSGANTVGGNGVTIGYNAITNGEKGVALGRDASAGHPFSVALGSGATTSSQGEINVGTGSTYTTSGYNSSNYRLLSGLYDAQGDHDAVTLGQLNGRVKQNAGAPTTSTVGTVGQLLEDTTNGKLYQCTAIDTTDPQNPSYTWTEVGAGGGGPTVVQTTGTSTTDVMSQNATASMVFADPGVDTKIKIGYGTLDPGTYGIAIGASAYNAASSSGSISIGNSAHANQMNTYDCIAFGQMANSQKHSAIAFGRSANASGQGAIALGAYSSATRNGEINVGTSWGATGFNSTSYRLISGVHDGQDAHDAATVAQGNTLSASAPDSNTVGVLGQLWTDTTNMHTYQCTAISGSTYTWTQRW